MSPPGAAPGLVSNIVSGDNTTGHVTTATVIGGALASLVGWFFQLGHIDPPPEVTAAFAILFAVAASYVMQRAKS